MLSTLYDTDVLYCTALQISVWLAVSHSLSGGSGTTPICSRKLHRRCGFVDTLWSGHVSLRAWSCAGHWKARCRAISSAPLLAYWMAQLQQCWWMWVLIVHAYEFFLLFVWSVNLFEVIHHIRVCSKTCEMSAMLLVLSYNVSIHLWS